MLDNVSDEEPNFKSRQLKRGPILGHSYIGNKSPNLTYYFNDSMAFNYTVSPKVFKALQTVDIKELSTFSSKDIRPILPCLVRMSLISPLDSTKECAEGRKEILTLLSGIEWVNTIVALLSIDFHGLELDVKKEQMLR